MYKAEEGAGVISPNYFDNLLFSQQIFTEDLSCIPDAGAKQTWFLR